ncbi:hypothetical protein V6C53_08275 [Desulfocurvibacter africanus]|uniref:hypothetical protein n=1 Tax=Desulfocurvibacter africanus TaxID=873 RepID=UPI002FDAD7A7
MQYLKLVSKAISMSIWLVTVAPFIISKWITNQAINFLKDKHVFSKDFVVWFVLNIVVTMSPILGNLLDGTDLDVMFPSILMIFVVLLATNTHVLFFHKKDSEDPKVYFAFSMATIIILTILASKLPYTKDQVKESISGWPMIVFVFFLSIFSMFLAWVIYYYKEHDDEQRRVKTEKTIATIDKETKDQDLQKAASDKVEW